MKGKDPAVSVVIPCRNEAGTLHACLDALRWQDLPEDRYEVILVDGGSTDGCRELAREFGVRVLDDPASGPSAARNVGIHAARADLVAFTDADCIPERDWLTSFREVFAEKPWIAGAGGALRMPQRTLLGRLEDLDALANYRGVITSNVAYRKGALFAVGGFDESLKCCEDYDLAWRLRDAGFEIEHDRRPVVTHAPPEVDGPVLGYLKKQFWYARNDVPSHWRAIRRWRAQPDAARGSRDAARGLAHALPSAGLLAAATAGAALAEPWLLALGAGGAAVRATRRVRQVGARGKDVVSMAALAAAKDLARGAGTLRGLVDLALPRGEDHPLTRASPQPWLASLPGARSPLPA